MKVKLTEHGEEILRKKKSHILNYLKDMDGYISIQTHELMMVFGNHIYNGCELPFDTNVFICIPDVDNISIRDKLYEIIKTHLKTKVNNNSINELLRKIVPYYKKTCKLQKKVNN